MNTIKCKHCGKEIEISEAIQHKALEQALRAERDKHQKELKEVKKIASEETANKIKKESESDNKRLLKDLEIEKERNKELIKQLEKINDELRQLRRKDEERDLEMKKKIMTSEGEIRKEATRNAEEEYGLKIREERLKNEQLVKALEEAKRKGKQGPQQAQGEVMELEIEEILKKEFPDDEITEIKKGQRGADVVQRVYDKRKRDCGLILWESKNAKWNEKWFAKLREDQREAKAQLAVLVCTNLPEDITSFDYRSGVWVTNRKFLSALALALRFDLIHINNEKLNNIGKKEKMEFLYKYLTSVEFKHRIEAMVESFLNLQDDIEKEKRYFNVKWARQEKELKKLIDNTGGIYAELQATTSRSLPEIKDLELLGGADSSESINSENSLKKVKIEK